MADHILVTGSSGMIGSVLGGALRAAGVAVTPLDRRENRWDPTLAAETVLHDLVQPLDPARLPTPPDVVVHCAANARVHDLVVEPRLALENVTSTFHALEIARGAGAYFIHLSSREVYGNQGQARYREDEVDPDVVESPYAASKLGGEAFVRSYGRAYGLPHAIVRLSNVYGRNDLSDRFIPQAFRCAVGGTPLPIWGADKRLDFTYVDDVVDALRRLVERRERVQGETFNIATGRSATLQEAAELVAAAVDLPLRTEVGATRPGEVTVYEADTTKAETLLELPPRTPLDAGVALARDWYVARFREEPPRT